MVESYEYKYIKKIIDLTINNKLNWSEFKNNNIEKSYKSDKYKFNVKELKIINNNKEIIDTNKQFEFIIRKEYLESNSTYSYILNSIYYKECFSNNFDIEIIFDIKSSNEVTMEYKMLNRLFNIVNKHIEDKNNALRISNIYAFLDNF